MSDTEREKDRKTLGYILKSRSEDMLHDYDDNKVFIFIILRARLDGSNSGAVLMEMLGCCERWTGAAPCCVCCAGRQVRTTLIVCSSAKLTTTLQIVLSSSSCRIIISFGSFVASVVCGGQNMLSFVKCF